MIKATLVVVLAGALSLASTAWAQAPGVLYFEGYLEDAQGTPVNDHLDLHFRLYDVQDAEASVWDEARPGVVATEGRFGVYLGTTNELSGALFAAGPMWVGVRVGDDDELRPRQQVAGVPYSLYAERAHEAANLQGMEPEDLADAEHGHPELHTHEGSVWTELNDGRGSGLNADLLRGQDTDALLAQATAQCLQGVAEAGFVTGGEAIEAVAASGQFARLDRPVQGDLDMGGHELRNPVIHNSEQAPAAPNAGQLWFDTSTRSLQLYDGQQWLGAAQSAPEVAQLLVADEDFRELIVGELLTNHADELRGPQGEPNPNAELLDGFDSNASDQRVPHSIPVTDESGRIRPELLPFSKGDLVAPQDRQLVEGLEGYGSDYFGISELGIDGNTAGNVRSGVRFGPGAEVVGTLVPPTGDVLPEDVCNGKEYVSGSWDPLLGTRTDCSAASQDPGAHNVALGVQYTVDGAAREGSATSVCYATGPAQIGHDGHFCADSLGDATEGDILEGKTAWVDGSLVVGDMQSFPTAELGTELCLLNQDSDGCTVARPEGAKAATITTAIVWQYFVDHEPIGITTTVFDGPAISEDNRAAYFEHSFGHHVYVETYISWEEDSVDVSSQMEFSWGDIYVPESMAVYVDLSFLG